MRKRLSILRYLAPVVIVASALAFGAIQTAADAECRECTQPDPTACLHKSNPDEFCYDLCREEYDCPAGGDCFPFDECVCREKR